MNNTTVTTFILLCCLAQSAPIDPVQELLPIKDVGPLKDAPLGFPPPEFDIEWEPATGPEAGQFDVTSGFFLMMHFLTRALLRPWSEVINARKTNSYNIELYVSGYPERSAGSGAPVLVSHVGWGFQRAFTEWEANNGYTFGRYYFLWNNERRGFLEMRRAPQAAVADSIPAVKDDFPPVEVPGKPKWVFEDAADDNIPFPNYRSWYLTILNAMIIVAQSNIDRQDIWAGLRLSYAGGSVEFIRAPMADIRPFPNGIWIHMLTRLIPLPTKYDPPRYVLRRMHILRNTEHGLQDMRYCVVRPDGVQRIEH